MAAELYAFTCGHLTIPLGFLLAGRDGTIRVPVPSFLVVHPKGTALFDSGLHLDALHDPAAHVGEFLAKFHSFDFHAGEEVAARLGGVGVDAGRVDFVVNSHLHFDHAGGTSRFPKAKFIVQRRELEYAAGALPHNSAAKGAFIADDVIALVQLNWQGRVLLADGDVEAIAPGVDVYLTPGHTAGTMTTCLDTVKGRVCYSSDAVYTYRNFDEDIPLGLALNAGEAVESYKKIRRILRGGLLIPGHEPRIFEDPKALGFRKVSEHAVAVVE